MSVMTEHQDGFSVTLEASLERLQQALRQALIQAGVQKPGPTAINRSLGLDKSIAWKIGRIAKAERPLQALEFLPGPQGARIVVDAFIAAKVPKPVHLELHAAFDALEQDIELHAGDRLTAKAMARAALSSSAQPSLDENLRREHFRTSSSIWGAQARVQLKADFIAPGAGHLTIDTAGFEGFIDLRRLRPGIPWRIGRKRVINTSGVQATAFQPLDPRCDGDLPLFHDHCSTPLPGLSSHEDAEGFHNFTLEPGRVGRTGSVNCLIATKCASAIDVSGSDEANKLVTGVHQRTPSELLVLDLFVHRSLAPLETPEAGLNGQLVMGPASPLGGPDSPLPVPFHIETLSTRPGGQSLLEVPGYSDAIQDAVRMAGDSFGRERWQLEDFLGYRVRLTYPPIPTIGWIRIQLPTDF
ncbi:MAG: hypothetical protein P1V81_18010 [Planctomycetota bacterium]|nr:hypothetical protein [Planctomycetota bacterium]